MNLPASYHECCSLIGYSTHYLQLVYSYVSIEYSSSVAALVNKLATIFSRFWSVFDEDLDKFLKN